MTYELVKKLKDAGFPQDFPFESRDDLWSEYYCEHDNGIITDIFVSHKEYRKDNIVDGEWKAICKKPTLSELIEACGEDFETLYKGRDWKEEYPEQLGKWYCNTSMNEANYYIYGGYEGSTPEEAVARLWLALHT